MGVAENISLTLVSRILFFANLGGVAHLLNSRGINNKQDR